MRIENIETPRLLIRGFNKADALWAYKIWNAPEMGEYLPDEAKYEIDPEYLKELEKLGDDDECCYLIPVFKDTLERVGTCSFIKTDDDKVYDIAYCVHKDLWGKGYATEIAKGLIGYAKSKGAERVTIIVNEDNIASKRVAEKCGGRVVSEDYFTKKGTNQQRKSLKYEINLMTKA